MAKQVTLRQAVDILNEQGIQIEWENGCTMSDFLSYYDQHYKHELENRNFFSSVTRSWLLHDIQQIFQ